MAITWKRIAYYADHILNSVLKASGDIIYASAANTPARLAKGTDGQVLTLASGVPSWATPAAANPEYFMVYVSNSFPIGFNVGTVRYFTSNQSDADATFVRIYIPINCTVKKAYALFRAGQPNDNSYEISIAKNGDTARELIGTVDYNNTKQSIISNTSMSLSLSAGDYINIKTECTVANYTYTVTAAPEVTILFQVA